MSPWVIPRADNDNTTSSIDPNRRCRLATISGSNDPARSRGTSIRTGPAFVNTVFARVPLRAFDASSVRFVFVVAEVGRQLALQGRLQDQLGQLRQQPVLACHVQAVALGVANQLGHQRLVHQPWLYDRLHGLLNLHNARRNGRLNLHDHRYLPEWELHR